MARAGELPVNVRVLVEGEEESRGQAVADWVREDERGADAAIVFDGGMADAATPAITVGLRGIVMMHLLVRVAERNLHSGMYGGSVLNALHVLHGILAPVAPGRRRAACARSCARASARRRRPSSRPGQRLPPGDAAIAEAGGRPVSPGAGAEYYERNGADAVARRQRDRRRRAAHRRAGARARVGLAAPRRRARIPSACTPCSRGCCASALPAGAELELESHRRDAGAVRPRRARAAPRRAGARARLRRRAGVRAHRRQRSRSSPRWRRAATR